MSKKLVEIEEDLKIEDAKVKISHWVDGDCLKAVKNAADAQNIKYTTLINKTLREVFLKERSVEIRLDELEKKVRRLEKRSTP